MRYKWTCPYCGWKNAIWEARPVGRLIHEHWKFADGPSVLPLVPCSWVWCRKCHADLALADHVTCLACEKCWAADSSAPHLILYDNGVRRYLPLEAEA